MRQRRRRVRTLCADEDLNVDRTLDARWRGAAQGSPRVHLSADAAQDVRVRFVATQARQAWRHALDFVLPDMNGRELVDRVRADPALADTAIVMVTRRPPA